jgi:hypothetical protein
VSSNVTLTATTHRKIFQNVIGMLTATDAMQRPLIPTPIYLAHRLLNLLLEMVRIPHLWVDENRLASDLLRSFSKHVIRPNAKYCSIAEGLEQVQYIGLPAKVYHTSMPLLA